MSKCLDLVQKSVKDITDKELGQILVQMRERQIRLINDGADPASAAKQASVDVATKLRMAAAIERRNAALNFRVRTEALDYIRTTWSDDMAEGVLAIIYGSPKARFGSRASAAAAQAALSRRYMAGVAGDLEKAGLMDVLRRGELDEDVTRALWDLEDEAKLKELPDQAVEVAKILRKWQDVARIDGNRAGAWIGKDEHYVVKQSHHPDRLQAKGEVQWKADILPRLDIDRMFPEGPPKDLDDWLHEAYLNLTTGVRPERGDATAERMAAFKGPGNLAKRVSQERVFHFRSADDWYSYNRDYGFGNLREAYIQGLHRAAESNGLMQILGTNPEFNLKALVTAIRSDLSRSNPDGLRKFDRKTRGGTRIENAYREISGITRHVASARLATVGAAIRTHNTLTGLGGAVVSSITDIPVRAAALKYQGASYLAELTKGVLAPIRRLVAGVGSEERRATLAAIGYFNEIALGNLAARFSPDESLPGRLQQATHTFFKWNLLGGWQDEMQRSSLESMGRFFGEAAGVEFEKLAERTRRTLERFRITPAEWDLVRRGVREEEGGERFLTPDAVRELPPQAFTELAGERIRALKEGIYERAQARARQDVREQGWVHARADKLAAALEDARVKLNAQLEKADGKGAGEVKQLQAKLNKLDEQLEFAQSYWDNQAGPDAPGIDRKQPVGFYGKRFIRDLGVDEGRVRERMKDLKADVREVTAAIAKYARQENKAFVARWQEREAEFIEFADGVDARIRARAESTAGELGKLDPQITRILEDQREASAMKVQTLYADEVKSAVIQPDARTMAFVRQGQQAGTPVGEALRLFWQFKTFGVAIMQRGFLREFWGYDKGRGGSFGMSEIRGLATFIAGSFGFGYIAMSAKDLLKGREPRSLDDPRTWGASFAQSGAMGIYGDFMFGESSRYGQSFWATLGGPTVGKTEQLWQLYSTIKKGDDAGAQAFRTLINNTPYNNLFYTRIALDYLVLYELQEAMNPGYLRRMERRVREENGQEFWLKPSEATN